MANSTMVDLTAGFRAPNIQRGDWLQTYGTNTTARLKFYSDAPYTDRFEIPWDDYSANYYIGPVHSVNICGEYQTVLVPHPSRGDLVYCNTWTCREMKRGQAVGHPPWREAYFPRLFCRVYRPQWVWIGWQNKYLDSN